MAQIDFMETLHRSTKRDYTERVCKHDKAACAEVAVQYGKDYWDGDRIHGYGGYTYDGRWRAVAESMIAHYDLGPGSSILDVGCGKGFLLYEFTQIIPDAVVAGIDISAYAVEHAKEEVRTNVRAGSASNLPYDDNSSDLVLSLGTLHNLRNFELFSALAEIERVSRKHSYVMVESFRNEREKVNMLNWQLTQRSFYGTDEWEWFYQHAGYTGDHGYIFFE
jgi:SAM-dependent methyltransferase